MSQPQLTGGICLRMNNASLDDQELFNSEHVVQFLTVKKVPPTGNPPVERHRVVISDGTHFVQAMLATQLNHLVHDDAIVKHSIVSLQKITCNFIQEKRYAFSSL